MAKRSEAGVYHKLEDLWRSYCQQDVEVWASNTLSRTATVEIKSIIGNARNGSSVSYDYSNCDLRTDFKNQYFTIPEIFSSLQETVREINLHGLSDKTLRTLNRIADESEHWHEDEMEVVPA